MDQAPAALRCPLHQPCALLAPERRVQGQGEQHPDTHAAGDYCERKEVIATSSGVPLRRPRIEKYGANADATISGHDHKERNMTRPTIRSLKWAALALALIIAAGAATHVLAQNPAPPGAATGLGQLSGLLPRAHLTEESALQVDLSNETVRLPLYPGKVHGKPVWYILLDASDAGAAHDLGVNYAPKLANIGIGCPACVQTVTLAHPTPAQNPFGPAVVDFQGAPDFSPTRVAVPGPHGFPLAKFQPGAVASPTC